MRVTVKKFAADFNMTADELLKRMNSIGIYGYNAESILKDEEIAAFFQHMTLNHQIANLDEYCKGKVKLESKSKKSPERERSSGNKEAKKPGKDEVVEIIKGLLPDSEGWIKLATVERAFFHRRMYVKGQELRDILVEAFEGKMEFENYPPKCRLRVEEPEKNIPVVEVEEEITHESNVPTLNKLEDTKDIDLLEWAYITDGNFNKLIELALDEQWTVNRIKNYLRYTFKRLRFEEKILTTPDSQYAAFNTGLVSEVYENIYAVFEKNISAASDSKRWKLVGFECVGQNKAGKILNSKFFDLPKRANYFPAEVGKTIYNPSIELCVDWEHCVLERIGRLPKSFLTEYLSPNFLLIDGISLDNVGRKSRDEQETYYKALSCKVKNHKLIWQKLHTALKNALELAKKRAEWDYRTAEIAYNTKKNDLCWLLPLVLGENERTDTVALLVTQEDSGKYQGQTILPISWAYNNVRLIARPYANWITVFSKTDEEHSAYQEFE